MATLQSYDLNGQKLSFANWVSNLSPTDTPFLSMTSKDKIDQTIFQWQTDSLRKVEDNAQLEGWESEGAPSTFKATQVLSNYTQILRKVVSVSDTAEAVEAYGRESEMSYQMEKASQELKRDLEYSLLNNFLGSEGDATHPRVTAGFPGLCSGVGVPDPDTGAIINFDNDQMDEESLYKMFQNLYQNGSNANVIMFHPKYARFFSKLQESVGTRVRFFENTGELNLLVNTYVDQFGITYKLIPNRWMPVDKLFFFNPDNWEQKVLRPPKKSKLGKLGSFTQWMIEMEVGLSHVNPEASGILNIREIERCSQLETKTISGRPPNNNTATFGTDEKVSIGKGADIDFTFKAKTVNIQYTVLLYQDGVLVQTIDNVGNADKTFEIISASEEHSGVYKFFLTTSAGKFVDESDAIYVEVK
ncbi:MAG: SU10 major capsid protein [Bacteroidales bacterium]